jgi:hypothetical protein
LVYFYVVLLNTWIYITLFTRVLLRPLGGVIFILLYLDFITLFYPLSLCDKTGRNFQFGPGMYFQTGQVFFVPEWPKGEFVSFIGLILCMDKNTYL